MSRVQPPAVSCCISGLRCFAWHFLHYASSKLQSSLSIDSVVDGVPAS